MPYHSILIIQPVIRAFPLASGQKPIHLIFIQIDETAVAFVILIIYIIDTAVTTGRRHSGLPFRKRNRFLT